MNGDSRIQGVTPRCNPAGAVCFCQAPMQLPSIAPGKRFTLPRPTGSADALLLARLGRQHAEARRTLVVFSAEPADTQRLADELPYFDPALRVAVFPDWETLPYDTFSPHQDLISERLATLWRIHSGDVDVVLLPATTALTRLAPPSFLAGTTFHFKQKARLDESRLKSQLTLAGYQHVSQVVSPGEYAVRGGLIDLFPMGSPVPYRVDLFGDQVQLIGKLTREQVIDRYARAAVYVQPSRVAADGDRDGIPNVLLEAMAMGVPVVATRISGIPEVVQHHHNGLLVAAEDPAAMADAVQLLIDAPALGAQLGREARRTVTTNFDNDHNLRVVLGLLEGGHAHDEAPCAVA